MGHRRLGPRRLLGIPSSDLDLALSNITGRQLGEFLESWSTNSEIVSKYLQKAASLGISEPIFSRFHVTKANATTARKLETAGGKLFGIEVDLVNLRKEVYDGHSRNPDMQFGTAEEDAFRRDATVNALFFHLERQEVFDLTGKGLADLEAKIIRTPLAPKQTLMDDPLRVLRLIRVASKLGFSIAPATAMCMADAEVHKALDTMIIRDRVGAELIKIMTHKNTENAFEFISKAKLFSPVFIRLDSALLHPLAAQLPCWQDIWPVAYKTLAQISSSENSLSRLICADQDDISLWTLAAYTPFAGLRHVSREQIVQEATKALKTSSKMTALLDSSLRNFDSILNLVENISAPNGAICARSECGVAIRSYGATWRAQFAYVLLSEALYCAAAGDKGSGLGLDFSSPLLNKFLKAADFVLRQKLQDALAERPLLNGVEIQKLLGRDRGGPYIQVAIDNLVKWQFDNTSATKEGAERWILEHV